MARAHLPGRPRTLALVDRSLPSRCAVCGGARQVRLILLVDLRGGGPVGCPHCANGDRPIPISIYPMRDDTPKDVA